MVRDVYCMEVGFSEIYGSGIWVEVETRGVVRLSRPGTVHPPYTARDPHLR